MNNKKMGQQKYFFLLKSQKSNNLWGAIEKIKILKKLRIRNYTKNYFAIK